MLNLARLPRRSISFAFCLVVATLAGNARAATTAIWLAPVSGDWTDATKWSTNPLYPNNFVQAGVNYDVLINQVGVPYTITTTPFMGLDSLIVDSPDATIAISSDLTVPNITVNAGAFRLAGSVFRDANISAPAGTTAFTVLSNSALNNVALGAGVSVRSNAIFTLQEIRPFTGGVITLEGDASTASLFVSSAAGPVSLSGNGQVLFGGTSSNNVARSNSGALTIGPSFLVATGAQGGTLGISTSPLINQGLISARTSGKQLTVTGSSVSNSGTFEAKDGGTLRVFHLAGSLGATSLSAGQLDLDGSYTINQPVSVGAGSTLTLRGAWTNPGGVTINGGTINLATMPLSPGNFSATNATLGIIGAFTTAQLETLPYTSFSVLSFNEGATLNNTGKTLHLPGGASSRMAGGGPPTSLAAVIIGGTIDGPADANLVFTRAGTLDGVTLNVDAKVNGLSAPGSLNVKNGLVLNKILTVEGRMSAVTQTETISGTGQIILRGDMLPARSGNLTIGPGISLRNGTFHGFIGGGAAPGGTITNNGQITAVDKWTLFFDSPTTNAGLLHADTGDLRSDASMVNTGSIIISASRTYEAFEAFTSNTGSIGGAGVLSTNGPTTIGGPQNWLPGAYMTPQLDTLHLNSNTGTPATAAAPAAANLTLHVEYNQDGGVVLGSDQDMHALSVDFWNGGNQSFDLNSPSTPGQFRSVRIYPGDIAAARAQLYADIVNANRPGSPTPLDGIFDSSLASHPNSALGLATRTDLHGDPHLLIRPTRIGDLDLDGTVTILDFMTLASHFNSDNAIWEDGDVDYDRRVTILDFIALAANFNSSYSGETSPISAADAATLSSFAAANVPEPAITPCLLGLVLFLRRPNKRVAQN